jgi:hypothetical protein
MEVLQWLNTSLHVILAGVIALLPGTLVWASVLAVFLLIKNLGRAPRRQSLQ